MTRIIQLDFGSGSDPDPAHRWDTKHKLFSLVEVYTPPMAIIIIDCGISIQVNASSLDDWFYMSSRGWLVVINITCCEAQGGLFVVRSLRNDTQTRHKSTHSHYIP